MICEDPIGNYFSPKELKCKCNDKECDAKPFDDEFLITLNHIRFDYNKPLVVRSACRCIPHNSFVGGAPHSYHLLGRAIDIAVPVKDTALVIAIAHDNGINRIGIARGWIHLDNGDGPPTSWFY